MSTNDLDDKTDGTSSKWREQVNIFVISPIFQNECAHSSKSDTVTIFISKKFVCGHFQTFSSSGSDLRYFTDKPGQIVMPDTRIVPHLELTSWQEQTVVVYSSSCIPTTPGPWIATVPVEKRDWLVWIQKCPFSFSALVCPTNDVALVREVKFTLFSYGLTIWAQYSTVGVVFVVVRMLTIGKG